MTKLLEIKEVLKGIYSKYDSYIFPVLKFLLALIAYTNINRILGEMSKVNNLWVTIILSLLCSFLPANTIVIFSAVIVLLHLYALSLPAFIVGFIIILLILLLYFRFSSKDSLVLILMPLAFGLKIPYAVPLIFGLISGPVSGIGIGCGVVMYYFLKFIAENASNLTIIKYDEIIPKVKLIVEYLIKNDLLKVTAITCMLIVIIVYLVRRMEIDYAWSIAITVGGIVNIAIMLIGDFALDVSGNIGWILLSTAASMLIAFAIQFFVFNVDYTRTERVQFEDDEYYYYVKAIPKIAISTPNFKVKKINPQEKDKYDEEQDEFDDLIDLDFVNKLNDKIVSKSKENTSRSGYFVSEDFEEEFPAISKNAINRHTDYDDIDSY